MSSRARLASADGWDPDEISGIPIKVNLNPTAWEEVSWEHLDLNLLSLRERAYAFNEKTSMITVSEFNSI